TGAGEPGADPDHGAHQGAGAAAAADRRADRAECAQRALCRRRCGGALAGARGGARPGAPARLRGGPAPRLPRVLKSATLRRPDAQRPHRGIHLRRHGAGPRDDLARDPGGEFRAGRHGDVHHLSRALQPGTRRGLLAGLCHRPGLRFCAGRRRRAGAGPPGGNQAALERRHPDPRPAARARGPGADAVRRPDPILPSSVFHRRPPAGLVAGTLFRLRPVHPRQRAGGDGAAPAAVSTHRPRLRPGDGRRTGHLDRGPDGAAARAARLASAAGGLAVPASVVRWRLLFTPTLSRHLGLALGAFIVLLVLSSQIGAYDDYNLAAGAIFVIATAGLNLLTGVNGQLSLGHGALMAVGAYSTSLLLRGHDLPLLLVLLASLAGASLVGAVFGVAAARLRGPYLAGATLALAVGLPQIATRYS